MTPQTLGTGPEAPLYDPVNPPRTPSKLRRFGMMLLVILVSVSVLVILAVAFYDWVMEDPMRFDENRDHLAGHRGAEGQREIPVDGKSNLPGDLALVTYKPAEHQFESVSEDEPTGYAQGGLNWSLSRWTPTGRSIIGLRQSTGEPRLTSEARIRRFIKIKADENNEIAGAVVPYREIAIGHRRAFLWTYHDRQNWWHLRAWFPGKHSFRYSCRKMPDDPVDFETQCIETLRTIKFRD